MPFSIRHAWLFTGWLGVIIVIYGSLYPLSIPQMGSEGDKLNHFLAYGSLFWWFAQASQARQFKQLIILLILMGIIIEFIQPYSNRMFDVMDMAANTGGVVLSLILVTFGINLSQKFRQKIQPSGKLQ